MRKSQDRQPGKLLLPVTFVLEKDQSFTFLLPDFQGIRTHIRPVPPAEGKFSNLAFHTVMSI